MHTERRAWDEVGRCRGSTALDMLNLRWQLSSLRKTSNNLVQENIARTVVVLKAAGFVEVVEEWCE